MKKLFTLIVLVAATYFAVPANAQLKFGIKGGLNITDMSLSNDVFETSNRTGFFIGPTIKFTLPIVGLGIDASALYDQREGEVNVEADDNTLVSTSRSQSIFLSTSVTISVWEALLPFISQPDLSLDSTSATRTRACIRTWQNGDSTPLTSVSTLVPA